MRLVLASGSAARQAMMRSAGLEFEIQPADVDEASIRRALAAQDAGLSPADVALQLAEAKAVAVAASRPSDLVVGSDQILVADGTVYGKAGSMEDARVQLRALSGRTHSLHSAVVLAEGGSIVWRHVAAAHLTMHPFSDAFLEAYLRAAGEAILGSVGCYHLEGPGVRLFDRIDGDHFTILGMPLFDLLRELRRRGLVTA